MKFIGKLIVLMLMHCFLSAYAMKEETKLWTSTQITGDISNFERWKYYIEPQLRFVDDKYKFNTTNLYLAAYFKADPQLDLYAGVFRHFSREADGDVNNEYRLWEQINWGFIEKPRWKLSSRTRLEERKNFNYSQIANRLREKLQVKYAMDVSQFNFLVVADELFLQLNQPSWVAQRVLSENRASIGFAFALSKTTTWEFGYINQFQWKDPNVMSHIVYVTLYKSFA